MKTIFKLLAVILGMAFMANSRGVASSSKKASRLQKEHTAIKILISPSGWGREEPHIYPQGKPIKLRCEIQNTGKVPVVFSLKDHDAYHGTLAYPLEVSTRIENSSGKIITANDIDRSGEGWWSQWYVWSTLFEPVMPGDKISLPAGGVVVRQIPLDQVISMCPGIANGLPQGEYTVQLRIGVIVSNKLKIEIGAPE